MLSNDSRGFPTNLNILFAYFNEISPFHTFVVAATTIESFMNIYCVRYHTYITHVYRCKLVEIFTPALHQAFNRFLFKINKNKLNVHTRNKRKYSISRKLFIKQHKKKLLI